MRTKKAIDRHGIPWRDFDDSELTEILDAIETFRDAMRTLDQYDISVDAIELTYEAVSDELDRRDVAEDSEMERQYEEDAL